MNHSSVRTASNFSIILHPMAQTPEERKEFLKEFNSIAKYTATVLHGDDVSKVRIKQIKQYFNRTYNMLNRIAAKDEINNKSFRYGYGGKILVFISQYCSNIFSMQIMNIFNLVVRQYKNLRRHMSLLSSMNTTLNLITTASEKYSLQK